MQGAVSPRVVCGCVYLGSGASASGLGCVLFGTSNLRVRGFTQAVCPRVAVGCVSRKRLVRESQLLRTFHHTKSGESASSLRLKGGSLVQVETNVRYACLRYALPGEEGDNNEVASRSGLAQHAD